MKKLLLIISIIGILSLIILAILFSETQCNEVKQVSLKAPIDFEKKTISPEITKICDTDVITSLISQDHIDELKSDKVKLLKTKYIISNLKEEIPQLESNINNMLEIPEEKLSDFHKNYLKDRQRELSTKEWQLENALIELPTITNQLEEKIENIKVAAANEQELDVILSQIESINAVPIIELDQKVYTWTDKVYLTIVDPLSNEDSHKIDILGGRDDESLTIQTKTGIADRVMLWETGYDTGIFTAEFILTGFTPFDANGDGSLNDVMGHTFGYVYIDDGILPAKPEDRLIVTYIVENQKFEAVSDIKWNIGEVQFLDASSQMDSRSIVRIIDPDYNLNPEEIDDIQVRISSSSDSKGINISLKETNESTAIFEGSVFLSSKSSTEDKTIQAKSGDILTATFTDYTLPKPHNFGDSLEITGTSLVK